MTEHEPRVYVVDTSVAVKFYVPEDGHAKDRMVERNVSEELVEFIVLEGGADMVRANADDNNNTHYLRKLFGDGRIIVVVDPHREPMKVVTIKRDNPEVRL